jgi:hypothetical protein
MLNLFFYFRLFDDDLHTLFQQPQTPRLSGDFSFILYGSGIHILKIMKRNRTDLTWWEPFKKWIQSNGGFVHSNIELSEDRELFCEKKVDPDTVILKIPAACLATIECATKSAPWLAKAVDAVGPSALYSEAADVLIALFLASQSPKELSYI